jgi:hypothetical protein
MNAPGSHFGERTPRRDEHLHALLAPAKRGRRVGAPDSLLHICPRCKADLVYPTDWALAGEAHWAVELRCPECEWLGGGIYGQDALDRFDVELDRGTDALIEDLANLTRANMEEEVERIATALRDDHILPEDF